MICKFPFGVAVSHYSAPGVELFHCDALDFMRSMSAESVDVVFTDPPYSSGARQAAQLRSRKSMRSEDGPYGDDRWFGGDNLTSHGFQMLVRLLACEALRCVRRDGHLLSFIDWRQLPVLQGVTESAGWSPRALLTWNKGSMGMGNGYRKQCEHVLHASKGIGDNFIRKDVPDILLSPRVIDPVHPTPKPIDVCREWLSALPGQVLVDPFCGSGRILEAARSLGWTVYGADYDLEYLDRTAERLSQLSLPLTTTSHADDPSSKTSASIEGRADTEDAGRASLFDAG